MKRVLPVIIFFTLLFACTKQENRETVTDSNSNTAQIISGSKGRLFGLTLNLGHSGTNCSGCVVINGEHTHADCQGAGNDCSIKAIIEISDSGEISFYYGTIENPDELTYEDFFLMPDRSLYIIGSNGEFLNIPEQTAYRDEETGTFIFYDIFFSDSQMFENE